MQLRRHKSFSSIKRKRENPFVEEVQCLQASSNFTKQLSSALPASSRKREKRGAYFLSTPGQRELTTKSVCLPNNRSISIHFYPNLSVKTKISVTTSPIPKCCCRFWFCLILFIYFVVVLFFPQLAVDNDQ